MGNEIKYREVRKNELSAILELYQELHASDDELPDGNILQSVWNEIINDLKIKLFVAEINNLIVASCILTIIPNLTRGARPYGLIENVITRKDFRKKGIGSNLLKYALNYSWKNNCYKVMLLTGRKSEDIFRFYQNAGFERNKKEGFIAYPKTSLL